MQSIMKKGLLNIFISCGLLFSASLPWLLQNNKGFSKVEAANPHVDNFAAFTYEGDYYDTITETGEGIDGSLRKALTAKIHPTNVPSYSGGGATHLSTVLQYADEDPTNKSNMIYLYTRDSVTKNAASSWNREHVWPQSLSNNCWGTGRAGTDLLHLRPTYNTTNSTRGNDKYGDLDTSASYVKKRDYNGMTYGYSYSGTFMPLDSVKGDVARIIMYVWTSYHDEYGTKLPAITNVFSSFDTLLTWHMNDKPDVMEGNRNEYSEKTSMQGNRNPFVDHPEYAWKVFGDKCSASVKQACQEAYPDGPVAILESISIDALPNKTEYYVGDTLNTVGAKIIGHYDNGASIDVTSKCTFSPKTLNTLGKQTITVTYLSKTTSFVVSVLPRPTYTVTFNANGGSGTMESLTVNDGSSFILPECKFTAPKNQEFNKWSINGKSYNVGTAISVSSNLEVLALWKDKEVTPDPETEVTLSDSTLEMNVGDVYTMFGVSSDYSTLFWSIDNGNVSLDTTQTDFGDELRITALKAGTTVLTAHNQYGVSASCTIYIAEKETIPDNPDDSSSSDNTSIDDNTSIEKSDNSDSSSENSERNKLISIPGCGGYISAASSIVFLFSLTGILFFTRKRKH